MSKSAPADNTRINLSDSPDVICKKIRGAVTDLQKSVTFDPEKRCGLANLLRIYAAVTDRTPEQVVEEYADCDSLARFKDGLVAVLIDRLGPIQREIERLAADRSYVEGVLQGGSRAAIEIADRTMDEVMSAVGLR